MKVPSPPPPRNRFCSEKCIIYKFYDYNYDHEFYFITQKNNNNKTPSKLLDVVNLGKYFKQIGSK